MVRGGQRSTVGGGARVKEEGGSGRRRTCRVGDNRTGKQRTFCRRGGGCGWDKNIEG
jgi:hypothetical protein